MLEKISKFFFVENYYLFFLTGGFAPRLFLGGGEDFSWVGQLRPLPPPPPNDATGPVRRASIPGLLTTIFPISPVDLNLTSNCFVLFEQI